MLPAVGGDETRTGGSSLWTTPVSAASEPLKQAAIDATVSAEKLRDAVNDARKRAAAFARPVTEALLRKSV